MLKNPYVSRAFGHLFDLVRLVMRFALPPTALTKRTFTLLIPNLTRDAGVSSDNPSASKNRAKRGKAENGEGVYFS